MRPACKARRVRISRILERGAIIEVRSGSVGHFAVAGGSPLRLGRASIEVRPRRSGLLAIDASPPTALRSLPAARLVPLCATPYLRKGLGPGLHDGAR